MSDGLELFSFSGFCAGFCAGAAELATLPPNNSLENVLCSFSFGWPFGGGPFGPPGPNCWRN
jgi:hypothetical protein